MFDRTNIHQASPYPQSINVTENRAPTPDSVRLLREMESAAQREVIKAVAVTDNEFNAVGHVMYEPMNDAFLVRVIFTLNKKKVTTDVRVRSEQSPDTRIQSIIDAVALDVTREILIKPLSRLGGELLR